MRGDAAGLRELPVADGAVEGLFATVCAAVRSQVRGLRERLVAAVAAVRTLAGVSAQVSLQRTGACVSAANSQGFFFSLSSKGRLLFQNFNTCIDHFSRCVLYQHKSFKGQKNVLLRSVQQTP